VSLGLAAVDFREQPKAEKQVSDGLSLCSPTLVQEAFVRAQESARAGKQGLWTGGRDSKSLGVLPPPKVQRRLFAFCTMVLLDTWINPLEVPPLAAKRAYARLQTATTAVKTLKDSSSKPLTLANLLAAAAQALECSNPYGALV
jgi:hypothetical protein